MDIFEDDRFGLNLNFPFSRHNIRVSNRAGQFLAFEHFSSENRNRNTDY